MIAEAPGLPTTFGVGGVAGLVLAMLVLVGKAGWQGIGAFVKIKRETDESRDSRNVNLVRVSQDLFNDLNKALSEDNASLRAQLDDANKRIDGLIQTVSGLTEEVQKLRGRLRELEQS